MRDIEGRGDTPGGHDERQLQSRDEKGRQAHARGLILFVFKLEPSISDR